jgi:hypothetical protein
MVVVQNYTGDVTFSDNISEEIIEGVFSFLRSGTTKFHQIQSRSGYSGSWALAAQTGSGNGWFSASSVTDETASGIFWTLIHLVFIRGIFLS